MTTSQSQLTPKQERFALAFLELGDASAAYCAAYDVGAQTKRTTIWQRAHDLKTNPKIAARIAGLQAQAAARAVDKRAEQIAGERSNGNVAVRSAGELGSEQGDGHGQRYDSRR